MGDLLTMKLPRHKLEAVPPEAMELARRRTLFLFARAPHDTLAQLLASAYLQGVRDCAQAIDSEQAQA